MKDFKSVLKIFGDKIDSMDFCDDFQRIESIFRYFDKYIKPLEKIHHKGGNEPYINDITTKIRQFLYSKNYVTDENQPNPLYDKELRKITFFLILNTNVSWKYDLTNDQTICHLIGILPKIPKCILLACIWDLNLSEYFYECISYSAGWLSLPIIDGAVDSLKYADAYQSLERVEKMVKAIYILIARYDYRQTASTKIEHKIMLSKFYDYTADFLRHFFTPDAEKFDKMTKFQFTIYKGYVLKHILHLILNCFEIYRKKPSFIIDEHLQIFQLMEDKEKTFDSNSSNYCATVDEILHKINITLLNSLQSSVMDVDVGTFTDWVEEDLDNDNDNETLQSAIGNAVYKVLQQISANDCFKHDVSKQLINLAIKPKTIQERAKESLLGDIIRKLDSKVLAGNERNVWLTEFLNRGALVFENDECMDTLKDNMEYLTFEHCQLILKYISSKNIDDDNAQSDNDNDNDDDEITNLNVIINKAMKKCNCKEIEEICAMIIDLKITICLKPNTFDKCLIEVFNKGTLTFYNQTDLCIMAQNPQVFFDRLFEYSYQNAQQLETFISFIRSASIVSAKLLPNCVANLFENKFAELTPTEENTIPPLMTELYCSNILSKDFITKLLYKMIMNSLEKNDWRKIIIILRILLRIVGRNDFGLINEPVIVVMVGQVLDKCRWDMTRYCEELEIIVCKSIEFIQEATKKFLPKANDIDKSWISSKIESFKPITRYYFQRYSLTKDDKLLYFDEYLREKNNIEINSKSEIIPFVCETLVRCTKKESLWLAKNSQLLPYFGDVLSVLSVVVTSTTVINSLNCFRHCFQSYLNVIKEIKLISMEANNDEKVKIIQELLTILNKCSSISIYNELFMNVHPILFDIAENSINIIEEICLQIDVLKDCEAKQLFIQKIELLKK